MHVCLSIGIVNDLGLLVWVLVSSLISLFDEEPCEILSILKLQPEFIHEYGTHLANPHGSVHLLTLSYVLYRE